MLQNIIKSRRDKTVTIKIVFGTSQEAEDMLDDLEDYKNDNEVLVEKMKLLYHLKDIQLTTVSNNVFIVYHFERNKEAKNFELNFTQNIESDGSNILESFLITQTNNSDKKEDEQFNVVLNLPEKAVKILKENSMLLNINLVSEPACPIFQDMVSVNQKKVKLLNNDFENTVVNISFRYMGTTVTRTVPQKWLEVEEIIYKAVVNTQWALNPKNIIGMNNNEITSRYNNK